MIHFAPSFQLIINHPRTQFQRKIGTHTIFLDIHAKSDLMRASNLQISTHAISSKKIKEGLKKLCHELQE